MKKNRINNFMGQIGKIRREASKDFLKFRQYYFGHYHSFGDATFHAELCQRLSEITFTRGTKNAIAAPRESAKSTLVTLEYVIYCICHKLENLILVVSGTVNQVERFMDAVKRELTMNKALIHDFPDVCETGRKPAPPRWTTNEIITKNGVNVMAYSVNQQVRGMKFGQHRPSLIILDDIEADESTKNPDNFYKLQDKITKSIIPAGTKESNVIYTGTIHHYNSMLSRFVNDEEFPGWYRKKYASVISWAQNLNMWEEWTKVYHSLGDYKGVEGPEGALSFFSDNKEQMIEGAEVLWPECKSYYDLMVLREQIGYVSFDSEMMNEPVNPRDCYFSLDEAHYWEDEYKTEKELFGARGEQFLIFGSCDPSLGKPNRNSDFSAIVSVAFDKEKGTIYVLDADVAKRKPDKIIDHIIAHHRRRQYKDFAFEAVQFQEYMANVLDKRASKMGERLKVTEVKHTSSKFQRIESLQPLVKNGTIRFSRKHKMLLDNMKFWPKGAHDDAVDALEMAVSIAKKPGMVEVFIIEPKDDNWISDYRRNFGWNI